MGASTARGAVEATAGEAKKTVQAHHSWETIAGEFIKLYDLDAEAES